MSFHVGQMVVCIDDVWGDFTLSRCPNRPVRGVIYTVREIMPPDWQDTGIKLEEIINPPHLVTLEEPGFLARRFRPVKETSIEIFRKLVAPIDGVSA